MEENGKLTQQIREMEHDINMMEVEMEGVKARNRALQVENEEMQRKESTGKRVTTTIGSSRTEDRQIQELQEQLRRILGENDEMKRHIEELALKYEKDFKSRVSTY